MKAHNRLFLYIFNKLFKIRIFFYILKIKTLAKLQRRSGLLRLTKLKDYREYWENGLSPNQVIDEEASFFKKG